MDNDFISSEILDDDEAFESLLDVVDEEEEVKLLLVDEDTEDTTVNKGRVVQEEVVELLLVDEVIYLSF